MGARRDPRGQDWSNLAKWLKCRFVSPQPRQTKSKPLAAGPRTLGKNASNSNTTACSEGTSPPVSRSGKGPGRDWRAADPGQHSVHLTALVGERGLYSTGLGEPALPVPRASLWLGCFSTARPEAQLVPGYCGPRRPCSDTETGKPSPCRRGPSGVGREVTSWEAPPHIVALRPDRLGSKPLCHRATWPRAGMNWRSDF